MSARILHMGMGELTTRGRQEAMKWIERRMRPKGGLERRRGPASADLERSFFRGATDGETPSFLRTLDPGIVERTAAAADAVCASRFDLLGYKALSFGDPIDWHLDPISGRRAPQVHWSRIDPLDPASLGDARLVWELNRHVWLVTLGRAYRLTGHDLYAEVAASRLRDWMRENPPGLGINWASSLEVGLRMISWCWALCLLRRAPAFAGASFRTLIRDWIAAHASHVARYLSSYHSPNTHLTGEALALFHAGLLFPELPPAWRWRGLGERILTREIHQQVLNDGVYFEQSTGYQRYTVEFYLHFLVLAAANGMVPAAAIGLRVQEMLDFLLYVTTPSGRLPQIGDADGAALVPLSERDADDPAPLFSTAAVLFDRPDYAWAAGDLAPETVWLLGAREASAFDDVRPEPPAASPSRLFAAGGYAVMRSDWRSDAHQLLFDVGPLGCPATSGHGHADLLSIQCSAFGTPYLVDPGTFVYTRHAAWRDRFRSTAAHNTLRVDGVDQAETDGPFRWRERPVARIRSWTSSEASDFACAEHGAYGRLAPPVTHRRTVVFEKPTHWVVVDELEGEGEHGWELRWQFAPLPVAIEPDGWVRARSGNGTALLMGVVAPVTPQLRVSSGDDAGAEGGGWVSPSYGRRIAAPQLVVSGRSALPCRIVTVIVPSADPTAAPPDLGALLASELVREGS
ncbi:MAG TPA: alginate lyase family protein [Candidatus Polarisedimenticolaceae bacterium]|nr:alginate lyase family protein [Candidatus Polarisedimenticolaceae bacterium]